MSSHTGVCCTTVCVVRAVCCLNCKHVFHVYVYMTSNFLLFCFFVAAVGSRW